MQGKHGHLSREQKRLAVLTLELANTLRLARRHPLALTAIDLHLAHPPSQRLGTEPQPASDRLARNSQVRILINMVKHQAHGTLLGVLRDSLWHGLYPVSYTHLRAHETVLDLVCRLLLEKKKKK